MSDMMIGGYFENGVFMRHIKGDHFEPMLPCISLWQPWAQWIALGWKTIETRKHKRFAGLEGKRIAIHAAQRWDNDWPLAKPWLTPDQFHQTQERYICFQRGTIVCTANVTRHRALVPPDAQYALCECGSLRYGLILREIKPTRPPFSETNGKQGIFYIPLDEVCHGK